MAFINLNIPAIKVYVRKEFFYDCNPGVGGHFLALILGVRSIPNRALGFHVLTETGVMFWNLPVQALSWKEFAPSKELGALELWNAFSYNITATQFFVLQGRRCHYRNKDNEWVPGEYILTFDWASGDRELDLSFAETPDEHKCAHFLKLDDGNFALQPNNRIKWEDPSFITKPFPENPDFKVNTHIWNAEQNWKTEDSDRFQYDLSRLTPGGHSV